MHNTTLMHLLTKNTFRWKKSAELPINPNNQKTSGKKNKKHRENQKKQKKQKNLGFQGKVLGVTSPKSLVFFCFFWFLWFFWFSRVFYFFLVFLSSFFRVFWFFEFSDDFPQHFFDLLPYGLFIANVAQTAPFPQNFAHAAPQHVCHIFSKANSYFISLLLGKSLLE